MLSINDNYLFVRSSDEKARVLGLLRRLLARLPRRQAFLDVGACAGIDGRNYDPLAFEKGDDLPTCQQPRMEEHRNRPAQPRETTFLSNRRAPPTSKRGSCYGKQAAVRAVSPLLALSTHVWVHPDN